MTTLQDGWLSNIIKSYDNDDTAQNIITGIAQQLPQVQDYKFTQGLIKYKGRLYVGTGGSLKKDRLWELHDSAVGGHSGQEATLRRISQFFYWPMIKQEIIAYVQACDTCQRIKSGNTFPRGLLQPLPIPT